MDWKLPWHEVWCNLYGSLSLFWRVILSGLTVLLERMNKIKKKPVHLINISPGTVFVRNTEINGFSNTEDGF